MKSLSFFMIIVLCFLSQNLHAQSEIKKLVEQGLESSYQFKWTQAAETFQKIIKKFPDDPRGFHYYSSIYLWYYLSNTSKEDLNNFLKYSDLTIEKAEDILEINDKSEVALYILGSNYNYRAIAFTKSENYLDAAWATKKSESFLTTLLEVNPEYTDAFLGLGLYNFAMGEIPSAFKWALNLAGISGDRETGLAFIKLAADKGDLSKVEAQYYYSQILSGVLFDYETASFYLKNLTKKYPDNLVFNYAAAVLEMKKRDVDKAEVLLRKVLKTKNKNFLQVISFSYFLMGDVFFRRNEFDSSAVYYKNFLEITPDNDYTGIASYRLALSYEILGDRKSAEKYYALAGEGNMDLEDDLYAKRRSMIFIKRNLTDNEIKLIKASNLVESGKYKMASDTLKILVDLFKAEKNKAEAYLLLSETEYKLENYDSSIVNAEKAIKLNSGEEKWIKPYGYFYLARVQKLQNNLHGFENSIEEAEDFSDYDYQSKLQNMIIGLKLKKNI